MYELIILGGGPAAISAGIYAGRKKIKALIIAGSFGGQSIVSDKIENWIGTKEISGFELAKSLEDHLRSQEGLEILEGELGESIEKKEGGFIVKTSSGKTFETKAVIIATGGHHRKLEIPGESKFEGK